jgi:predicted membrane chloride channel (bestrophin family)
MKGSIILSKDKNTNISSKLTEKIARHGLMEPYKYQRMKRLETDRKDHIEIISLVGNWLKVQYKMQCLSSRDAIENNREHIEYRYDM